VEETATRTCQAGVFPMLNGRSATPSRFGRDGWVGGAGTWFFQGKTSAEALRLIATEYERRPDSADWIENADGAFAIAVISGEELQVFTDLLGTYHIYAQAIGPHVAICTSSLVLASLTKPSWDPIGCRQFLATGTVFETRTLFEGIEKLSAASVYRFRDGRLRFRTEYWNVAGVLEKRVGRPGDVGELAGALGDTLRTISANFARPVLDLTGGFDSRAVLGAALGAGATFETIVNGKEEDGDVAASKRIAREFGLRHHHGKRAVRSEKEWSCDVQQALRMCDGEYDVTLYAPTLVTHKNLSTQFEASINGSNGEIAKGYWWELLVPFTGRVGHFDARRVASRRFAVERETAGLLAQEHSEDLADMFTGIIQRANTGLGKHPNTAHMDNVYLRLRMQRWQGRIASASARIWPVISPFCFRAPMEAALSAPAKMRWNNRMMRLLIELQNPKLAALPLAQGYPAAPLRVSNAHQFHALYRETIRAIVRRGCLTVGLGKFHAGGPGKPQATPALWTHELTRDLLDPAVMTSRALYRSDGLREILDASRAGDRLATTRSARILTLEMLAHLVRNEAS
jgi:hypothetical protein